MTQMPVAGQTYRQITVTYPLSTVSAHVSACPNHQTLRRTPLTTRFAVAAFAVLGHECNFCDCTREELEEIRAQIALYRKWRSVLQQAHFIVGGHLLTEISQNGPVFQKIRHRQSAC